MRKPLLVLLSVIFCFQYVFLQAQENKKIIYPAARKSDQVDDYFGTKVSDPYRWLEDGNSAETKAWVQAEQSVTEKYLSAIPFRNKIREHYKEILNHPKYFGAFQVGEYYFYSKNDGLQNQSVFYFQKGLNGKAEVFLDPNSMSADGSVSVVLDAPSPNKKYIAYHINKGGSDWATTYVMDIENKKKLPDVIEWMKFGGIAWKGDGFYYTGFDKPEKGKELSAKTEFGKVYYHQLGNKQEQDQLIFEDKQHPQMVYVANTTEDERFLILYKYIGTYGTEIWVKNLAHGQQDFTPLIKGFDFNNIVIDDVNDKLLMYTNSGAGNYRVVLVDPDNPQKENWKEIIAEREQKLESASTGGRWLFASYLKDASTRIYQYDLNGVMQHEVKLPGIGSASGISAYHKDTCAFYDFSSFTYAPSIFKYDFISGKTTVFKKSETKIATDNYQTEQVFYTSKDRTKIPMFIVHKKEIKLDGTHPVLLYAYGGFDVSMTPYFSTSIYILLENNGIFALPNIRGGGEYGEKWHRSGELFNKQNVFDDFIAAAEYLIANKYTTKNLLAINGGSNGGLLIGAVMTQRPDLFKVCFPDVGVMDMLRFQKFTVGWAWAVEYGSSDSAIFFPYLYKYSPLHNIKAGVKYPATMISTADHDDRVVPAHSFKFAATLQEKQSGTAPTLIRIETDQGHGASGSSLSKDIESETDKWSFMFYNMGITPVFAAVSGTVKKPS
ncbi:MAG: S9 family peptidase [Bacteroidetes bacterium]|nr:S9 family peptidase [Bacteroidota bacterium]